MIEFCAERDNRESFLRAVGATPEFLDIDRRVTLCLQVPRSFEGLWTIAGRLEQIVFPWSKLDPESPIPDDVSRWVAVAKKIAADDVFRSIDIIDQIGVRTSRSGTVYPSQIFKDIVTKNPVWISLWYQHQAESVNPESRLRAETFTRIQAAFVAAFSRLAMSRRKPSVSIRPYEASILIFNLHGQVYPAELDACAGCAGDARAFHEFFKSAHLNGHEHLRQGYGALADLLNEGFELGRPTVFIQRTPKERRRPRKRAGLDVQDDEVTHSWVLRSELGSDGSDRLPAAVEITGPGRLLENDLIQQGLNPLEFSTADIVWLEAEDIVDRSELRTSPKDLRALAPLGALYAAARARQRAEVMSAQLFTTRLGRTRPVLLARIFNVLEPLYRAQLEQGHSSSLLAETLRFLAVMIVTGAAPESICNLHCYESPKKLPKDWLLAFSSKYKVWLHPYLPPERQPLADRFKSSRVENFPRVARSDIWRVGMLIGEPVEGKWFLRGISEYKAIFDTNIVPKLKAEGLDDYCKFESFRDIAYSWFLGRDEGDQLRVAVVFDRDAATCETQHSYTAFDRASLDNYYVIGMKRLWHDVMNSRSTVNKRSRGSLFNLGSSARIPEGLCGDDLVPRMESLMALVQEMKTLINQEIFPYESNEYHNLITTYLGLGLAVTLGFRDIRTPIPDLTLIDSATGFMSLQEKDRKDGAHARLVWIAPRLSEMIVRYMEHLKGLWARMPSDRHTRLYVRPTKHRDKSQFNSGDYGLSLLHTLYFLEHGKKGGKAVEFTGTAFSRKLDEILSDHWPVSNAGRHFLRTNLVALGCPAVVINTLLGHWHVGELSWGDDSALDPHRFREIVAPYIERILDDLGFEVLEFK